MGVESLALGRGMADFEPWLALMIGNSRLHWAYFAGDRLQQTWDSPHRHHPLELAQIPLTALPANLATDLDPQSTLLAIASVVPQQTGYWQSYPFAQILTLSQIPLTGLYPSLGIDRALGVLGLGAIAHYPCLVIDGGTALTLTGVDGDRQLIGGAIFPGINLQRQSLAQGTASLPQVDFAEDRLPPRWAKDTASAIASGILYSTLAGVRDFIQDWQAQFPQSAIAFTGGDGFLLYQGLQGQYPELIPMVSHEPHLIALGIRTLVRGKGR